MDVNDMIKDMEAYRQGFEEGRNNALQSFLPLLERMCLDIDLIKKRIIPEPPKESKELTEKANKAFKEDAVSKSNLLCMDCWHKGQIQEDCKKCNGTGILTQKQSK